MIPSRFAAAVALLVVLSPALTNAQVLSLGFEQEMSRLISTADPGNDSWQYYVTREGDIQKIVRKVEEIKRYIIPVKSDKASCRFRTRGNYVGVARTVDPVYANARRMTWQWSVDKHPHNGKLAGVPNDQSISVMVIFREPKEDGRDAYTSLCYSWTAKTTVFEDRYTARMPWKNARSAEVVIKAIRNGPSEGQYSEDVEVQADYQKGFSRTAPPIYGIIVISDSNDTPSAYDKDAMTTDATIGSIKLYK